MVEEKELEVWLLTMNTLVRLASLITFMGLAWNHAGTINDFLQRHEITRLALLCRKGSTRAELLSWLQSHLPMHDLTLHGERTLWTNGSLLCTLVNIVVPEACLNPNCHQNETPKHGQVLAYKYLGILPEFTEDELNQIAFTFEQEKKLINYLSQIKAAITNFTKSVQNMKFCTDYIAKGMGLVTGEQNRKGTFFIYPIPKQYKLEDVLVFIRGPYGSYGQIIIPAINQNKFINTNYKRAIYLSSKVSSISPTLQGGMFLRKLSQNYGGGNDFDIQIKIKVTRTHAKVSYIPKNSGIHEISLVTNNYHLIGSPFGVPVDNPSNKYISDNDSLSDDEFDKIIIKKQYISGIVDVVGEKMLLNENGTLEKLKKDNRSIKDIKYLNETSNKNDIKTDISNKVENVITTNKIKEHTIEGYKNKNDILYNEIDTNFNDIEVINKNLDGTNNEFFKNDKLNTLYNSKENESKNRNDLNKYVKENEPKNVITENNFEENYRNSTESNTEISFERSENLSKENDELTEYSIPNTNLIAKNYLDSNIVNNDIENFESKITSNTSQLKKDVNEKHEQTNDSQSILITSRSKFNKNYIPCDNSQEFQNKDINSLEYLPPEDKNIIYNENQTSFNKTEQKNPELKYKILEMTDDNLKIEVEEINKVQMDSNQKTENNKRLIFDNSEENLINNTDEIITKQNQYTENENNKDYIQLSILKYLKSNFYISDNDLKKQQTINDSNETDKKFTDIYETPDILETNDVANRINNDDSLEYSLRKTFSKKDPYYTENVHSKQECIIDNSNSLVSKFINVFENKNNESTKNSPTINPHDYFKQQEESEITYNFENNDPDLLQCHATRKKIPKSNYQSSSESNYPQNAKQYRSLNKKLKKLGVTYKSYDKKQRFLKSVLRNDLNKNFQHKDLVCHNMDPQTNNENRTNLISEQKELLQQNSLEKLPFKISQVTQVKKIPYNKFEIFTKTEDSVNVDIINNYSPKTMKIKKQLDFNNQNEQEILDKQEFHKTNDNNFKILHKESLKKQLEDLKYLSLEELVKTKKKLFEKLTDNGIESKNIYAKKLTPEYYIKQTESNIRTKHIISNKSEEDVQKNIENNHLGEGVKEEDFKTVSERISILLNKSVENEETQTKRKSSDECDKKVKHEEVKNLNVAQRVALLNEKIQDIKISDNSISTSFKKLDKKSNNLLVNNKNEENVKEQNQNENIQSDVVKNENKLSTSSKGEKKEEKESFEDVKIPTIAERIATLLRRESDDCEITPTNNLNSYPINNYENDQSTDRIYQKSKYTNTEIVDLENKAANYENDIEFENNSHNNKTKRYDSEIEVSPINEDNHKARHNDSEFLSITDRIKTLYNKINSPDSGSLKSVRSTLSINSDVNSPNKNQKSSEIEQETFKEYCSDPFNQSEEEVLIPTKQAVIKTTRCDTVNTSTPTLDSFKTFQQKNSNVEDDKILTISERIAILLNHDKNINEDRKLKSPTDCQNIPPVPKPRLSLIRQYNESKDSGISIDPEVSKTQKNRFQEIKKYFEQLSPNSGSSKIKLNEIQRSTSVPCISTNHNQKLSKTNSMNSINILEKCCVPNLYKDISGDSVFLGIPNKTAVVANLINLKQKDDSEINIDNSNMIPEFENEYPYLRKTDINNFKSRSSTPGKTLMIQTEKDIYI